MKSIFSGLGLSGACGGCVFSVLLVVTAAACGASEPYDGFSFEEGLDLRLDGVTWLRTVTTPFDPDRAELTYKVFTHLYDFEGAWPITKGAGGRYTHHRGLFIGWNHTLVGEDAIDTWHMRRGRSGLLREQPAHQQLAEWLEQHADADGAVHTARILWAAEGVEPFIEEERRIAARTGADGMRVVDFVSTLNTLAGPIRLRGDAHHAGMQVRMSNEVVDNEDETVYILPEGAERADNDIIPGIWWMCGSMPVRGTRYWVLHMTAPDLVTGAPDYSLRKYGRFGAFFEPDLEPGAPLRLAFRVILSKEPLDQAQCQALYDAYCAELEGGQ